MADRRFSLRACGMNPAQQRMCDRTDGRIDREAVRHFRSRCESEIDLLNLAPPHRLAQHSPRIGIAREQDCTRRASSQTMHGCHAVAEQYACLVQHCIFEIPPAWQNRQSRGFVQDGTAFVFMQHIDNFGHIGFPPGRTVILEHIARTNAFIAIEYRVFSGGFAFSGRYVFYGYRVSGRRNISSTPRTFQANHTALDSSPPLGLVEAGIMLQIILQYRLPVVVALNAVAIDISVIQQIISKTSTRSSLLLFRIINPY